MITIIIIIIVIIKVDINIKPDRFGWRQTVFVSGVYKG